MFITGLGSSVYYALGTGIFIHRYQGYQWSTNGYQHTNNYNWAPTCIWVLAEKRITRLIDGLADHAIAARREGLEEISGTLVIEQLTHRDAHHAAGPHMAQPRVA